MTKLHAIPYILILCAMPYNAYAAEVKLPIRATVIQCGAGQDEIKAMCAKDARCCVFVK